MSVQSYGVIPAKTVVLNECAQFNVVTEVVSDIHMTIVAISLF